MRQRATWQRPAVCLLKAVQNATLQHTKFPWHDFMIFRPKQPREFSYVGLLLGQAQISEAPPKTPRLGLHVPWQLANKQLKNSLPQTISTTPGRIFFSEKNLPQVVGQPTTNLPWETPLKINYSTSPRPAIQDAFLLGGLELLKVDKLLSFKP